MTEYAFKSHFLEVAFMCIDWEKIVPTVVGGVLALSGSFGAIYFQSIRQVKTLRNSTSKVVHAEIEAILELIKRNEYIDGLKKAIAESKENSPHRFTFSAERSFTKVFETHLANIGLLDDASKVLRFYMLINSALEDKDALDRHFEHILKKYPNGVPFDAYDWKPLALGYEAILSKLLDINKIGPEILSFK